MNLNNLKTNNILEQITSLESQLKTIQNKLEQGFILFNDNSVKGFHTNTDDFKFVEITLINLRKFILKNDYCSIYKLFDVLIKEDVSNDLLIKIDTLKNRVTNKIENDLDDKFIGEILPYMLNNFLYGVNENDKIFLLNLSNKIFSSY